MERSFSSMKAKPDAGEYAGYYEKYVALVPPTDIVSLLEAQRLQMAQLLAGCSERDGNFRYAPGKWTVKEVIGHLADCERIFTYRALRIARGDATPLPGFEQDDYVKAAECQRRDLRDLSEELSMVRAATVALYRSLDDKAWLCRGVTNNYEVSVRALAYITAGHELHHRRILDERYFAAIPRA
jgi:uncharacterized damage-inducible protein DinB